MRARPGQIVIITDPQVTNHLQATPPSPPKQPLSLHETDPFAEVIARFTTTQPSESTTDDIVAYAGTAVFGQSLWLSDAWDPRSDPSHPSLGLFRDPMRIVLPVYDRTGCRDAQYPKDAFEFIAYVQRGKCTFFEKLLTAKQRGAIGVVVYGTELDGEQLIRPSADGEEVQEVDDVGIVYIGAEAGKHLAERLWRGEDISVSFTTVDADFENLDIASVHRLIEQKQKDIDNIKESLATEQLESWWDALSRDGLEDLVAEAMDEDHSTSTSHTDQTLTPEGVIDAINTAVDKGSPTVIPAGVMILGLPIANLFIMPAT